MDWTQPTGVHPAELRPAPGRQTLAESRVSGLKEARVNDGHCNVLSSAVAR